MSLNKQTLTRLIPVTLLGGFMAWVISQANLGQLPALFDLYRLIPYSDKLGHFCLFGALSGMMIVACKYKTFRIRHQPIPIGALIVLSLAVVEECSQLFLVNRNFDLVDLSANVMGILFSCYIVNHQYFKSRFAPENKG